jgi:predicted XRE-type DNA-binding protein
MKSRIRRKVHANADALNILASWHEDDLVMQQMIAEERTNAAVAWQIHALRKARGLTQRQLAELVGTKQPVIARLEDADYEGHSLSMLSRIAEALGCSVTVTLRPRLARSTGRRVGAGSKRSRKRRQRSAA